MYATSTQFRFALEVMLRAIRQCSAAKILADDTRLEVVDFEDRRWLLGSWIPCATAAGLRFVAAKKAESYFAQTAVATVHTAASPQLVPRSFGDLDEARDWLRLQN